LEHAADDGSVLARRQIEDADDAAVDRLKIADLLGTRCAPGLFSQRAIGSAMFGYCLTGADDLAPMSGASHRLLKGDGHFVGGASNILSAQPTICHSQPISSAHCRLDCECRSLDHTVVDAVHDIELVSKRESLGLFRKYHSAVDLAAWSDADHNYLRIAQSLPWPVQRPTSWDPDC
jgi:hypothetical protein